MKYSEEKINKLPKWAKEYIEYLEMKVQDANSENKKILAELKGEDETNVSIEKVFENIPLPKDSKIGFKIDDNSRVTVELDGGRLYIDGTYYGQKDLMIKPCASNAFYVEIIKR